MILKINAKPNHGIDIGPGVVGPVEDVFAFVKEVARTCGAEMSLPLSHDNKAEYGKMEAALQAVPQQVPEHVRDKFREYYLHSRLSGGREAVLTAMQ